MSSELFHSGLQFANYLHNSFPDPASQDTAYMNNVPVQNSEPPLIIKSWILSGRPLFKSDYKELADNAIGVFVPIGKANKLIPDLYIPVVGLATYFYNYKLNTKLAQMETVDELAWLNSEKFSSTITKPVNRHVYSEECEPSNNPDESGVYCCLNFDGKRITEDCYFGKNINTSFDLLCFCSKKYGDKEHLGRRKIIKQDDGTTRLGEYVWYTYNETVEMVKIIGSALTINDALIPKTNISNCKIVKQGRFLGLWAVNCPYWLLTDYACMAYGLITVPIYETLGDDALIKIITETRMSTICIDSKKLPILMRLKESIPDLKTLIIFDDLSKEEGDNIRNMGFSYMLMDDMVEHYKNKVKNPPSQSKSDVCSIIYTSGTGGLPKGAVFDNEGVLVLSSRLMSCDARLYIAMYTTIISYLPLSHVYQRFVEHFGATFGIRIGYFGGNIRELLDDIVTLRPDFLIGVPRAFQKILGRIREKISEKSCIARFIANTIISAKLGVFCKHPENPSHWLYDKLVMNKVKDNFGGNIRGMVLGSAAMTKNDIMDLQNYLSAPISEGYGTTEVGVVFLQDFRDLEKGTIGGPLGGIKYKLRSVPEMEYYANGNPPRGELLVKGRGFMLGYFLNEQLTNEVLDKEGWYRTGDIVEILPNMAVRILDRARNLFKLNQGEYIAPEKLENIYLKCELVEQIFIHGENTKTHIIGIVVINEDQCRKWAVKNGHDRNTKITDICASAALNAELVRRFEELAVNNGLNSLEKLKVFMVTNVLFSSENGMLTPTFKSVRSKIRHTYKLELEKLYASAGASSNDSGF
ncbi:bifunctional AMP-dependent synthetase-ligase/ANL [Babesia duncani]|uniref:Bifunctional AMP-dependent synthetase-ligase/ANL n=1 Tax=Babesia duncani TaxID=323732 RepID=A0AAD9PJ37_9APIC|nr:bifunctional AMP-dependent synthetase-ligase/ANL [Babesia duncani]